MKNRSVENADVAFVKGANERNEFFEKIKKTTMHFLRFCMKNDKRFSKYRFELIVALPSTNATKAMPNSSTQVFVRGCTG